MPDEVVSHVGRNERCDVTASEGLWLSIAGTARSLFRPTLLPLRVLILASNLAAGSEFLEIP